MSAYLSYTAGLARDTPPRRNRVIDFWRMVAILVVVFGHWLAASIWIRPDDEIELLNSLEWIPYAGWVTWVVQVMPIFFLVGGYANARALRRVEMGEVRRRDWITARVRRLFTPVVPLIVVWTLLIITLSPFVDPEVLRAGAMAATVPLWFMAVYLVLVSTAPWTHRAWLRSGWWSVAALIALGAAMDWLRFGFDVPVVGWLNFLFMWAAVHQLGYWWAQRDNAGRPISPQTAWTVFAGALGVLVALTWSGTYPVAMLGIPGAELTNVTPPTVAIFILGVAQAGVIWGTEKAVRRWTSGARAWHVVVAVSGVIMTLYLWHLSAMAIVASGGIFLFDGAAFRVEPGTTAWWLTRPIWVGVLVAFTLLLVYTFAPFEWRINQKPAPEHVRRIVAGVLLTAGSAAAVSYYGLVSEDASINWIIPAAAIGGAVMIGAIPRRRKKPGSEKPEEEKAGQRPATRKMSD
jgi:hypothetical protein